MTKPAAGHPQGDLGRRAAHRREELGLTWEEVAERSGMNSGYVAYLETHPPNLSRWSLNRLARALRTTPEALLGSDTDVPPGGGRTALPDPVLAELSREECLRLVSPGGVGRVAFTRGVEAAPTVLPVNFAVVSETVVFCTAFHGVLATHATGEVAFEVDQLDGTMSEGWSVLLRGTAHPVLDEEEQAELRSAARVRSWAGPDRDLYVRITPGEVTGRRIHNQAR